MMWPRLFGRFFRFDEWSLYRGWATKRTGSIVGEPK